jgi:Putative Flp pilus-assembly TadE/G-like
MACGWTKDRRGSVTAIAAGLLTVLIGVAALAVEYGHGLLARSQDQRAADLAAYGAAVVYGNTSSTTTAQAAANNIAALNGIPTGGATYALVASPTGDGNQAVQVGVTTTEPLVLARVLGTGNTLTVKAASTAEFAVNSPACIIALNSAGAGVALSGGTSVSAPGCAVASNNSVSAPCGTNIVTKTVVYGGAAPTEGCSNIKPPAGTASVTDVHATTADPLKNNTEVTAATARLTTVAALTSPSGPSASSGSDIAFGYTQSTTISQVQADGCTASMSGNTWTVTCSGSTFNFGNITLSGGITVNFNTSGSASTTYNFTSIINNGTALSFGPGTYNVAQGINNSYGATMAFGAGTFNIGIGAATATCGSGNYSGQYAICNNGTSLTFGGPSTFVLAAGIYNNGGETLTLGSGSTNSFNIGYTTTSSGKLAFFMGGGATTTFADATGSGDIFQMNGDLDVQNGGGSCLTVSAAAEHDINGYLATAGGTILGAGIYTVEGYVGLGSNGGGNVTCGGQSVGLLANGVTFVIGGNSTVACGNTPSGTPLSTTFCVANGYSSVDIAAPSSGSTEDLAVIGPTNSQITAGAAFTEGATNNEISGAFYFPNGAITLSGAAALSNAGNSGQCLELIGSEIDAEQGSAAGTTCTGLGSGSAGTQVNLVQ